MPPQTGDLFLAWSRSHDRLWRMRERLRADGIDPQADDTYVVAYCEHYDTFTTPPAYPGVVHA